VNCASDAGPVLVSGAAAICLSASRATEALRRLIAIAVTADDPAINKRAAAARNTGFCQNRIRAKSD
jgi:hypothetical protein